MTNPDISLIDNTLPATAHHPDEDTTDTSSPARTAGGRSSLSKRFTKGSVREGLARRKYAKWQLDRFTEETTDDTDRNSAENSDRSNSRLLPERKGRGRLRSRGDVGAGEAVGEQVNGNNQAAVSRSTSSSEIKRESEIDVLYENQRGWFFFGIPLYSRQSLLNFDPAGWETKDYKPSPVDITNAQLPDPSWEWVWKMWYVDMSYDVDEEGWQYSFSFSSKFSWHGTQPWFHSFVRRRRWLRKRAKRKAKVPQKGREVEVSHMLNDEYFTIHPSMLRSRDSSAEPGSGARSSFVSRRSAQQDEYLVPGEIGDILALMKCLKTAMVDREKIDMVKQFVAQGGDDLHYLSERIPDIMSFFIYQNSRRQLVAYLQRAVDETSQRQTEDSKRTEQEVEAEARKLDYLRKAVAAAEAHIVESEYWSDVRALVEGKDKSLLHPQQAPSGSGKAVQYDGSGFEGFADDIQGIPEDAGVGVSPGLKQLYAQQRDDASD